MADEPEIPDPQPPVDAQQQAWQNARAVVLPNVLEWAARMWLTDADAPGDEFLELAASAFERAARAVQGPTG